MTKFSKVAVVFITFAAMAFVGFAAVTTQGPPDWNAQLDSDEFRDYVFEKEVTAEATTWSVKTRKEGQSLKSSPILAEVLIAAREHKQRQQTEQIRELDQSIEAVRAQIDEATALIATDVDAMEKREQQLRQELADIHQQNEELSQQTIELAEEAQATRNQAEKRRQDVFRLISQLEEIRTDQFQLVEQRKRLDDLLVRLRGTVERLDRRREQLVASGAKIPYEQ